MPSVRNPDFRIIAEIYVFFAGICVLFAGWFFGLFGKDFEAFVIFFRILRSTCHILGVS